MWYLESQHWTTWATSNVWAFSIREHILSADPLWRKPNVVMKVGTVPHKSCSSGGDSRCGSGSSGLGSGPSWSKLDKIITGVWGHLCVALFFVFQMGPNLKRTIQFENHFEVVGALKGFKGFLGILRNIQGFLKGPSGFEEGPWGFLRIPTKSRDSKRYAQRVSLNSYTAAMRLTTW